MVFGKKFPHALFQLFPLHYGSEIQVRKTYSISIQSR